MIIIVVTIQMILALVICCLAVLVSCQNRVIEITTSNVQLVLKSVGQLHLLFHNSNCPFSKEYAQKYLQVKTPLNMGIADCQIEKGLCDHLNITHFPTLTLLTSNSMTVLDEYKLLEHEGLISSEDPKVQLNEVITLLQRENKQAIVILEEQGLPVLDKIREENAKNIFYVSHGSRFHKYLSGIVGNRLGCWILQRQEQSINKYYCGSGYRTEQIEKNIQKFNTNKLSKHFFTRQTNSSFIQSAELAQIIKQKAQIKKCRLIYFYSKECEHCQSNDLKKIEKIISEDKYQKKYTIQVFDIDQEQIPTGLNIKRVPQLVQFCRGKRRDFGNIFTLEKLNNFLLNANKQGELFQGNKIKQNNIGEGLNNTQLFGKEQL